MGEREEGREREARRKRGMVGWLGREGGMEKERERCGREGGREGGIILASTVEVHGECGYSQL